MKKEVIYDPQINFLKYNEIKFWDFKGDYNVNPLVPIYLNEKAEINLPGNIHSNIYIHICNKLLTTSSNLIDRKPINCIRLFNNSKKLISGTSNGNLIIYDIINNNYNCSSKIQANQSSIRSIQFARNDTLLLTGDNTGTLVYFDEKFEQKKSIKAHNDKEAITDICFSVTNEKFITSSDDKTSKIFDLETSIAEVTFTEHGSDIKTCDWNPYKNLVVTGGKDQLLKIWDPRTEECYATMHPHKNTINRLRFNKNGNWLLSASKDHSVKVIDIRIMKEMQLFKGHKNDINTIAWHPRIEELFCSAGADGNIIFHVVGESKNYVIEPAHDKEVFDLCFNDYGTLLVSGSNDASVKFWIRKMEY